MFLRASSSLATAALALLAPACDASCRSHGDGRAAEAGAPAADIEPPPVGRLITVGRGKKVCALPLHDADDGKARATYAQELAALRDLARAPGMWERAETGTCGAGYFTLRSVSHMAERRYFDAAGALVGVTVSVDDLSQYCEGRSGTAYYGAIPACTGVTTDVVLKKPGEPLSP